MTTDPLTAECPYCLMPPGEPCSTETGKVVRTHKARAKLAYALAAHADPALDEWPQLGPVSACGLCGSGLPQRHRIVDAIAGRLAGGEDHEDIAADYGLPMSAIQAIIEWDAKWGRQAWS